MPINARSNRHFKNLFDPVRTYDNIYTNIVRNSSYLNSYKLMPKKLLIVCAVVLCISSSCFCQESNNSVADSNQTAGVSLLEPLGVNDTTHEEVVLDSTSVSQEAAALEKIPARLVTAVEVKGNKSISGNTIISKLKTRVGQPYQDTVISDDLKRLYLLGFFSDIKINSEDYKDGVKVVIAVEERPIIEKITFDGMYKLTVREEKIKEQLKSKEGQYLDYPTLPEDVRTFKKLYEKIGLTQVEINYLVDLNKDTNKAKIAFTVFEGKRFSIKKIIIEGNKSFSGNRILKVMKTKQGWLFNAGVLKEDVLKEDVERIKSFYNREGYTDVEVVSAVTKDPKKPFQYVTITIVEGNKYLVGDVTIKGNKDITEKQLMSKLQFSTPGKVFSSDSMKQDIAAMQGFYFDRGYISAQVQESTALNALTGRIDISYDISENEVAFVNKIKIRGNVKTRDKVVRRELRIRPGDRFDGEKLKRSKERLQNLGFFEEVSYDTEDTQVPDQKDLVVEVRETKTGTFSFGGGYSTVDKLVGFVEIEQKNFDWKNFPYFTGAGQDLKLRASFGSITKGYDLSFTEPWLFDYPVAFGFDLYSREHKRETDIGYGYDEKVTGGDLRLAKDLTEFIRGSVVYRLDSIKITNITEEATNDLKKEEGTNKISSLEFGLDYDGRDNVYDTRKGDLFANSFQVAGGFLGADKDFGKYSARYSHYFPMWRNSVLEVRGRIGLVKAYGDSKYVPIYEKFFAGGAGTIRGYHERKVGPVDPVSRDPLGGESMAIANIEYTYPVLSFLKVAAFYDVGNVWEKMNEIGSSKNAFSVTNAGGWKNGIGLGVRVKTPIGPLMLDYGIPLNKEAGEDSIGSGKVHFSMSHGF